MIIFPAIDLYDGCAVRLLRGDYNQKTVYSHDPSSIARAFRYAGATHIHLVDLEGARDGTAPNLSVIQKIKTETDLYCEVGGGIRNDTVVSAYLDSGVDRVILGTAAVMDPDFLVRCLEKYPGRIAVGMDLYDNRVAIRGWTQDSGIDADTFLSSIIAKGVDTVICTDISKDGAMQGTNRMLYHHLMQDYSIHVIASGGVSSLEDLHALSDMGIYGAIIGKAYYTGAIDLRDAIGTES